MVEFSHAIIFVSDMTRSVTFYRDVLGLLGWLPCGHSSRLDQRLFFLA